MQKAPRMMGDFRMPVGLSLLPAGGYHVVQKVWEKLFTWGIKRSRQASIPVISVGNVVMGGSGKTPFVIFLATMLEDMGMKPAVISRGYRGTNREPFLIVGDGISNAPLVGPDLAGDEPYLLAQRLTTIPVLVGRERIVPVEAAVTHFGCNVAVLDDGFQHHAIKRDLDIVLLTGREDRMFPAGHLREPLSALRRADVVVSPALDEAGSKAVVSHVRGIPAFRMRTIPLSLETGGHTAQTLELSAFAHTDVVLASGIADPNRFRRMAEALGWKVRDHCCFPDHHLFSDDDVRGLLERFPGIPLVFTEKDRVKLPRWFTVLDTVAVLRIGVALDDEEGFRRVIRDRIPCS